MKMIKITEENAGLIRKALGNANGKATAHTFTRFREIAKVTKDFEERLSILQKKDWNHAKFVAVSGKTVPNCYDYARKATKVTIERRPSGFFLVEVSEATIYKTPPKNELILTAEQDSAAITLFKNRYRVAV